jgi:septal ring factor EnvC (AmiA/AmiB activator)
LGDIEYLGACKSLVELDIRWNPFDRLPHWRLYTLHCVRSLILFNNDGVEEDERRAAIDRFSKLDKECMAEELAKCRKERDKLKVELFSAESRISAYTHEVENLQMSLKVSLDRSKYLEKKLAFSVRTSVVRA